MYHTKEISLAYTFFWYSSSMLTVELRKSQSGNSFTVNLLSFMKENASYEGKITFKPY